MRRALFITLCIFTLTILTQARSDVTAQTTHYFAYHITADYNGGGYIALLQPEFLDSRIEYVEVPIEADWRAPRTMMSPDGEWVAAASSIESEDPTLRRFLRLFNLATQEIRNLQSGYIAQMGWSADGKWFAYNQSIGSDGGMVLYSIENESSLTITDDYYGDDFAFSPSSEFVASLNSERLEIFTTSHGEVVQELMFAQASLPSWIAWYNTDLQWSPDGRYLSFIKGFAPTYVPDRASEVFLWDTLAQTLRQVTDFVSPVFREQGYGIAPVTYTTLWYDADTLLIGVTYSIEVDVAISGTYAYQVSEETLTQIADLQLDDAAVNPVSNQVAAHFSVANIMGHDASMASEYVEIFTLTANSSARADMIVNHAAVADNLPNGCHFLWSNDGSWLAYQPREYSCPYPNSERLVFVNVTTGEYSEFTPTLPDGSTPLLVVPLGWVAR